MKDYECKCPICGKIHSKKYELPYNYRQGKKCPICGINITNWATTCKNCIPKSSEQLEREKRNKTIYELWQTGKYTKRKLGRQFLLTPSAVGIIIEKIKRRRNEIL